MRRRDTSDRGSVRSCHEKATQAQTRRESAREARSIPAQTRMHDLHQGPRLLRAPRIPAPISRPLGRTSERSRTRKADRPTRPYRFPQYPQRSLSRKEPGREPAHAPRSHPHDGQRTQVDPPARDRRRRPRRPRIRRKRHGPPLLAPKESDSPAIFSHRIIRVRLNTRVSMLEWAANFRFHKFLLRRHTDENQPGQTEGLGSSFE